jgi:hypothetical protein
MDPLVHVAEQAPDVLIGARLVIYAVGLVVFTMSFLALRRAIAMPNSGQGTLIAAGLVGGALMLAAPALPNVLLATVYGDGVSAQPLLSRIPNGDPVTSNRLAALQILALIGWIFAFKGLVMFARGAPRGTCTYSAAFWTFVSASICTAPLALFNLTGNSLGFGPLFSVPS